MIETERTHLSEEDREILKYLARLGCPMYAVNVAEHFGHYEMAEWASPRLKRLVAAGLLTKPNRLTYLITDAGRREAGPLGIDWSRPGRMISGSKRAPEGHICVWNANVCTRRRGKIWYGDLDLTVDAEDLKALAKQQGETVFVLRELAARFETEQNPRFQYAVAIIEPSGEMVVDERRR
jgi:hypothetical protein